MILVRRYAKEENIFFIWSSGFSDVQVIPKLNIKIKVTNQAPAVQKVDSAIHWTNLSSVDNAIGHFTVVCVQCPGLRIEARLEVILFCYKSSCFSYANRGILILAIP